MAAKSARREYRVSDEAIDAFVRERAESAYHPSCTCKMGAKGDPMAVVDRETRVFGVEALRVVDCSIMPSITSGNLNAPTIMIGEKVADISSAGIRCRPPTRPSMSRRIGRRDSGEAPPRTKVKPPQTDNRACGINSV